MTRVFVVDSAGETTVVSWGELLTAASTIGAILVTRSAEVVVRYLVRLAPLVRT